MSKRNGKVTAFTSKKSSAPGPTGKTDSKFKPGLPMHASSQPTVQNMARQRAPQTKAPRPSTQGQSVANSGDKMPVGGHNAPRGQQYAPPGGKRSGAVTSKITPTSY